MSNNNLYNILGVNKNADAGEIRKAYMKLARTHHPDKGGDVEEFKRIQQAFEILSDDSKRNMYDMTGQIPGEGPNMGEGGPGFPDFPGFAFDINNLFGMFGQQMNGGPGTTRRRGGKAPAKVETVSLDLSHFYNGHNFKITLDRHKFCTTCKGDGATKRESCSMCQGSGSHTQVHSVGGMVMHSRGPCPACMGKGSHILEKCSECTGAGRISEKKTLDAIVSPGIRAGEVLVFSEACSETQEFEKPGDLHIIINESENKHGWKRIGPKFQHLENIVTINLAESLTGCKIRLEGHPAYDDGLFIQIPAGSFTGDIYCISGLGMPIQGVVNSYGDLYIKIQVSIKLTERRILSAEATQNILSPMFSSFIRSVDGYTEGETEIQKDLYLTRA